MKKAVPTPIQTTVLPGESNDRPIVLVPLDFERRGLAQYLPAEDLVVCGPGREGIRRWADLHSRTTRPVVMAGLGGGLDPALPRNSVVVASEVFNPHGPTLASPLATAINAPELPRARMTSSLRTVASAEAKADLYRTSGAGMVDLESVPFAQIAEQLSWNWGIIRVICDAADETLPTAVDRWVDHAGNTRLRAIARDLFQRPSLIPRLGTIRDRAKGAIDTLGKALSQLEIGKITYKATKASNIRREILVFGGTFDPPHRSHVEIPFLVAKRIGCQEVVFVPASVSPLKQNTPPTPAKHRLEMLRLALVGMPVAKISRCELTREGPSYMVDTLEYLRGKLRDSEGRLPRLRLLMGSDQALQFTMWHEWKRILDLATPVVVLRPPYTRTTFARALADASSDDFLARSWLSWTVDIPPRSDNSTNIREQVRRGEDLGEDIPEAVAQYIMANGLYASPHED